MRSVIEHRAAGVWAFVAVLFAGALSGYPFTPETLEPLVREHGWIESTTNPTYGLAIIALFAVRGHDPRFFLHTAFVVALMGARELDWHRAFTTDSVSKLRFFTGDHVGPTEKLVVGTVLLGLAVIVSRYLRYWRRLRDGITHGSPAAHSVLLMIVLVPVTKTLDSSFKLLRLVEESMELTLPVLILIAVAQYVLARRTAPVSAQLVPPDPSAIHG